MKEGQEPVPRVGAAGAQRDRPVRRRLAPEARAQMILEGAVTFFAEHGFEGQVRDLAESIGVSQSLIFTYFGNKVALLERVYDEVYLSRWRDSWLKDLADRSHHFEERLNAYYISYLEAIDEPIWIRIVLQSGLSDNELTRRYVSRRVEQIVQVLVAEVRSHFGASLSGMADEDVRERVWDLQGSFIYGLIRKHVWRLSEMEDRPRLVSGRVSQFLRGFESADLT